MPASARRVLILQNPLAGPGKNTARIARLKQLLLDEGIRVEVLPDVDEISARAKKYLDEGVLRAVVGAGGDGTAAELANRTPPGTPLAVLPLGTENLLSKYLGQMPTPEAVCQTISAGVTVRLDAGQAGERLFILMASAGFDAEVVRRVEEDRVGNITHWNWLKPIWQTIRSYQYPELRLTVCDEEQETRQMVSARWAFVVNLPRYARGLTFTPDAVGTDCRLDVCAFGRGSLAYGLRYLTTVLLRRHERLNDCHTTQARTVRIESDVPVPYQLDGDAGGWLPVDIRVVPQRLTLLVPRVFATENGFQMPQPLAPPVSR